MSLVVFLPPGEHNQSPDLMSRPGIGQHLLMYENSGGKQRPLVMISCDIKDIHGVRSPFSDAVTCLSSPLITSPVRRCSSARAAYCRSAKASARAPSRA